MKHANNSNSQNNKPSNGKKTWRAKTAVASNSTKTKVASSKPRTSKA